jgi:hypothetical protein
MASNRIYPIKRCENPACQIRHYFTPHDKRQKYCTKQCRNDHSNDKRSLKEKSLKAHLKKVDEQDQKLHVLYTHLGYKSVPVEDFMLHLFEIDLSLARQEKHLTYKKEVLWFQSYGIIKLNRKGTLYQIVCRNDSK